MTQDSKSIKQESRETQLPCAMFSAVIGMLCLAMQIFLRAGI